MKKLILSYATAIFLTVFICTPRLSIAQKKKDIKLNRVKSISVLVSAIEDGKDVSYKESYVVYAKNGTIVEQTYFNPDGSVQKKETQKLDKYDNVIEETKFEEQVAKKRLNTPGEDGFDELLNQSMAKNCRRTHKFDNTNKKAEETEEIVYSPDGKQIKRITYSYNPDGAKSGEIHFDAGNKKISSFRYSYNGKSLRTKKEEFDADNKPVSVKRYTYEFY